MNKYLSILKDLNVELNSYTREDWAKLLEGVDKDSSGYVALESFVMEAGLMEEELPEDFEPMNIYAMPGTKVMFMNKNGTDQDLEFARESGLDPKKVYTVLETEVGGWSSLVYLVENEMGGFNTVMFKEVK